MSIDLSKLSSKELFELAKQREKEEHEAEQRVDMLKSALHKRDELIAEHELALAAMDRAIKELQVKREQQVESFEATLTPIKQEIAELERRIKVDETRAKEAAAAPISQPAQPTAPVAAQAAPKPVPPASPVPQAATTQAKPASEGDAALDKLYSLIRDMMRNRSYISESLMKEKLKAANFDTSNLRKQLEQLMHDKRVENKGRGNYALGKRK